MTDTIQDTRARIAGRKAAEELVAFVEAECEGQPLVFVQTVWRLLQQRAIKAIGLPRAAATDVVPMNDAQAEAFAQCPLNFGKYHGHTVGDVAASNPEYLALLADGDDFRKNLKRYLARHKYDGGEDAA